MNIDKFKLQHRDILADIALLRQLVQQGIAEHANEIAKRIIAMSGAVKLHLTVEDRVLYPALAASPNADLARMGQAYQDDMAGIAGAYLDFAAKWNSARTVGQQAEIFRTEANWVLKILYERIKKEDAEFYPAVEAAHAQSAPA